MQQNSALGRVLDIVRELRRRCPWDRVQTRETLRPYLVEEVLELDHALGEGDPGPIRDEVVISCSTSPGSSSSGRRTTSSPPTRWPTSSCGRCSAATPTS